MESLQSIPESGAKLVHVMQVVSNILFEGLPWQWDVLASHVHGVVARKQTKADIEVISRGIFDAVTLEKMRHARAAYFIELLGSLTCGMDSLVGRDWAKEVAVIKDNQMLVEAGTTMLLQRACARTPEAAWVSMWANIFTSIAGLAQDADMSASIRRQIRPQDNNLRRQKKKARILSF